MSSARGWPRVFGFRYFPSAPTFTMGVDMKNKTGVQYKGKNVSFQTLNVLVQAAGYSNMCTVEVGSDTIRLADFRYTHVSEVPTRRKKRYRLVGCKLAPHCYMTLLPQLQKTLKAFGISLTYRGTALFIEQTQAMKFVNQYVYDNMTEKLTLHLNSGKTEYFKHGIIDIEVFADSEIKWSI